MALSELSLRTGRQALIYQRNAREVHGAVDKDKPIPKSDSEPGQPTAVVSGNKASTSDKAVIENLVGKACQGDNEALYLLCQRIARGVLFRTSRSLENKLDAEDASQEIMLRVCSKISDLNDPKAFNGWLNSIIINETRRIGAHRSKQAVAVDITDYYEEFEEEQEDLLPLEYTLRNEDRREIIQIIDKLPDRQKEAVVLHYYEGFNVTEIAEMMEVTHQSVSRYLKLAREKVKFELARMSAEPTTAPTTAGSSLAVLPTGALLGLAMQQEAALPGLEAEHAINDVISRCAEMLDIHVVEASVSKSMYGLLASLTATLTAATSLIVGAVIMANGVPATPPDPPALVQPAQIVNGFVRFTGNNPIDERINPTGAYAAAFTEDGDMVAVDWYVTTNNSDVELASGQGGVVETNLAALVSSLGEGEYLLHFKMRDLRGDTYVVSSNFYLVDSEFDQEPPGFASEAAGS